MKILKLKILLVFCTFGLILIIPLITNSRVKSKKMRGYPISKGMLKVDAGWQKLFKIDMDIVEFARQQLPDELEIVGNVMENPNLLSEKEK